MGFAGVKGVAVAAILLVFVHVTEAFVGLGGSLPHLFPAFIHLQKDPSPLAWHTTCFMDLCLLIIIFKNTYNHIS